MRRLTIILFSIILTVFALTGQESSSPTVYSTGSPRVLYFSSNLLPNIPVQKHASATQEQLEQQVKRDEVAAYLVGQQRIKQAAKPARSQTTLRSTITDQRETIRDNSIGEEVWVALAKCESGGNPTARSSTGKYTGAFQFSNATWQSLGYSGAAADYPYEVQLEGAKRLQARSGWGQWPRCSRRLGLL